MSSADPRHLSEGDGSANRALSHGRGGAGNFAKERSESFTRQQDLETPKIKADHYTTGRGGSGNMAKNDPSKPEVARAAQDVNAPKPREHDGIFHFGRGGAANVASDLQGAKKGEGHDDESMAEKGKAKGLLEKIVGKK